MSNVPMEEFSKGHDIASRDVDTDSDQQQVEGRNYDPTHGELHWIARGNLGADMFIRQP